MPDFVTLPGTAKLLQEDLEKLGNSGVGRSTCPLTIKCFMTT